MNDSAVSTNLTLVELGVLAAGIAAALVLFLALKRLRRRTPAGGVSLYQRTAGPLAFLVVALTLKLDVVRSGLRLGGRFTELLNAGIVFLAVLFVVRLVDGWLLRRFERKRVPFPLPGVLHGFILIVLYLLPGDLGYFYGHPGPGLAGSFEQCPGRDIAQHDQVLQPRRLGQDRPP
ncbi:MAG: hypothetical protein H6P98_2848 [Candidatus Aminicenantes bacterium]|nr:hypothetical protein [Candidatus Aminicenantes bacterium]